MQCVKFLDLDLNRFLTGTNDFLPLAGDWCDVIKNHVNFQSTISEFALQSDVHLFDVEGKDSWCGAFKVSCSNDNCEPKRLKAERSVKRNASPMTNTCKHQQYLGASCEGLIFMVFHTHRRCLTHVSCPSGTWCRITLFVARPDINHR